MTRERTEDEAADTPAACMTLSRSLIDARNARFTDNNSSGGMTVSLSVLGREGEGEAAVLTAPSLLLLYSANPLPASSLLSLLFCFVCWCCSGCMLAAVWEREWGEQRQRGRVGGWARGEWDTNMLLPLLFLTKEWSEYAERLRGRMGMRVGVLMGVRVGSNTAARDNGRGSERSESDAERGIEGEGGGWG